MDDKQEDERADLLERHEPDVFVGLEVVAV
jgi:hypothetical protein